MISCLSGWADFLACVQLLSSVETWERLEKLLDELLLVCEVSKVCDCLPSDSLLAQMCYSLAVMC